MQSENMSMNFLNHVTSLHIPSTSTSCDATIPTTIRITKQQAGNLGLTTANATDSNSRRKFRRIEYVPGSIPLVLGSTNTKTKNMKVEHPVVDRPAIETDPKDQSCSSSDIVKRQSPSNLNLDSRRKQTPDSQSQLPNGHRPQTISSSPKDDAMMGRVKRRLSDCLRSHDRISNSKTEKESDPLAFASMEPHSCPFDLSPDLYIRKLFSNFLGYTPVTRVTSDLVGQLFPPIDPDGLANYKADIVSAVRDNDLPSLKALHADGRSMSCCNRYGESLLHMACRRGYHSIVFYLLSEANVPVRLADDCGRNVLHDALWHRDTQYEIVDQIIRLDPVLLLACDNRGYTPFTYARKEHWPVWRQFLWDRREHMRMALEKDRELIDKLFQ